MKACIAVVKEEEARWIQRAEKKKCDVVCYKEVDSKSDGQKLEGLEMCTCMEEMKNINRVWKLGYEEEIMANE